mmetsp:Transcript_17893/g.38031  ORF Transcript_17893/g.38031 Transcript_17893/m.38031 type:complete len:204 (+) Transcript_17893:78-689(+)
MLLGRLRRLKSDVAAGNLLRPCRRERRIDDAKQTSTQANQENDAEAEQHPVDCDHHLGEARRPTLLSVSEGPCLHRDADDPTVVFLNESARVLVAALFELNTVRKDVALRRVLEQVRHGDVLPNTGCLSSGEKVAVAVDKLVHRNFVVGDGMCGQDAPPVVNIDASWPAMAVHEARHEQEMANAVGHGNVLLDALVACVALHG